MFAQLAARLVLYIDTVTTVTTVTLIISLIVITLGGFPAISNDRILSTANLVSPKLGL